uniref:bifunctional heptose 7-phosphate kinase/heptose 1-phosphate adenyltransferase n=1 Tax=Herbidospora sakaeratensis TaxID=564415 RepID=UPI00078317D5|nr:PfkB family carbohydrate kinase [Herbidospora sakaeratensis]
MKAGAMVRVPAEFRLQRVVVVGDAMVDTYLRSRRSYHHETEGQTVISAYAATHFPGGAANVAANIGSLGGQAVHLGVVGDDEASANLHAALERGDVRPVLVVDPLRPTTTKLRVYDGDSAVVRVDTESTEPIGDQVERDLLLACLAELDDASALVVSDYRKGVVTASLAKNLLKRAHALGIPAIVDSKSADLRHFEGCTVFKSNLGELESVIRRRLMSTDERIAAARWVSGILGGATVVVTEGEHGILRVDPDGGSHRAAPPRPDAVRSVIGAGDTVAACLALACAAGMDVAEGVDLALRAAAEAVADVNTAAVRGHIRA